MKPEGTCPEGHRISTTVAESLQDRPFPEFRDLASGVPGARKDMAAPCANGYDDRPPVECPGAGRHLRKTPLRTGNMYTDVSLFIDGAWTKPASGRTIDVVNPATGDRI